MILIVVRHLIRPQYADESPRMVGEFTAATRAEPGTISLEWSRSTDDPAVYFLIEAFRDATAGEAHVSSSHFKAAIARLPDFLAARRRRSSMPTSPLTGGRAWQSCSPPPARAG